MMHDPINHHADPDALTGLAHRVRQHVRTPVEIVRQARQIAERQERAGRPHDAAFLRKYADAFEAREVLPAVTFAEGLETLARALKQPEQQPEEARGVVNTGASQEV